MKKIVSLVSCIILISLLFTGCDISKPSQPKPNEINSFKNNYKAIETIMDNISTEDNIVYSPLSFNFALGMISNGANSQVKEDFEKYFDTDLENYNNLCQNLTNHNNKILKIANSIWVRENYELNKSFMSIAKSKYNAKCESLPFNHNLVNEVNKWCAKETNNLIPSIMSAPPSNNSKALLANALYFKGEWEDEFDKDSVQPTTFTKADNTKIEVEGMYGSENIYIENDNAIGFIKYYKSQKYAFVGILPNKEGDFTISSLDLETLMNSKQNQKVDIMLPKFTLDTTLNLTDQLNNIGLSSALTTDAFPDVINKDHLNLDTILQKTYIKLDEKGTEAAAVTGIILQDALEPNSSPQVYLDRPFAFMIYDVENDLPIFVGKVMHPTT